jgi:hypothetical protein
MTTLSDRPVATRSPQPPLIASRVGGGAPWGTEFGCSIAARSMGRAEFGGMAFEEKPLSALQGEREGPGRASAREGEADSAADRRSAPLPPERSAGPAVRGLPSPPDRRGERRGKRVLRVGARPLPLPPKGGEGRI